MTEAGGDAANQVDVGANRAESLAAPPVLRAAPPTRPGEQRMPERRPSWPMGIGITGIVLSVLGGLSGFWWAISPLYIKWTASWVPGMAGEENPMFAAMQRLAPVYVVTGIAAMLMCGWLLVSSILLIKRRRIGVVSMHVWGWAAVVFVVLYAAVYGWTQFDMMREMTGFMERQAASATARGATPPPAGLFKSMGIVMAAFTFVFTLLLGEVFPVIVLYFVRRKKSREYVGTWAK